MTVHAIALLQQANEPVKALAIAERLKKVAKPDDVTPFYLLGESRRKMGEYKAAIEQFEMVLARKPEALNTRFAIASCYEKLGDGAKALMHFEEFARRFPKDSRASEAAASAKRLRKAGSAGS
jgi:tetratricopeptide (TPR) repeat protein